MHLSSAYAPTSPPRSTTAPAPLANAFAADAASSAKTSCATPADSTEFTPSTANARSPVTSLPLSLSTNSPSVICCSSIQPRLTLRPRLPAPVNPQPLVRIPPNPGFDCARAFLRSSQDVRLGIAAVAQTSAPARSAARSGPSAFSQTMNPGSTAAPVFKATRASPDAVHACRPKNFTKTPCGGVIFVSIKIPTVSPLRIELSSPRAKSSLCSTRLPCMHRIPFTNSSSRRLSRRRMTMLIGCPISE